MIAFFLQIKPSGTPIANAFNQWRYLFNEWEAKASHWLNNAAHWLKAFNEKGRNRYIEEEFTKPYDRTTTFSGQSTAEGRFPCCSMDHADFYLCLDL
jgi:hypothetical protein